MISLVEDTISQEELDKLADWLRTGPRLTKGPLTLQYEKEWAEFIGARHAVFVNSGSSAILLGVYGLLARGDLKKGDSVVIPSLSWATNLAPIEQLGLVPILCDCNLTDLSIDLSHCAEIFETHNPSCLMLVSVLGLVPDMDAVTSLCERHKVILLEDACESLGSAYKGTRLGAFGLMSFFSTYFGHHLSTIEGGMIVTNDTHLFNVLKSLRSHGWDRDMDAPYQQNLRESTGIKEEFDALYKFHYFGFNLRSTDLQAFLGLEQLKRLPDYIKARNFNYNMYKGLLRDSPWSPPRTTSDCYVSNMAYPLLVPNRSAVVRAFQESKIETRPLICGSLGRQPFWVQKYGASSLLNADRVDREGLYLPNHPRLSPEDLKFIATTFNNALK